MTAGLSTLAMVTAITVAAPSVQAASGDGPTLKVDQIMIQDEPAWPAYFVRDTDTDYQVRYTQMGTLAGVYGHEGNGDTSSYAASTAYGGQHSTVPDDTRFTAVGDLDDDDSVEVVLAGGEGNRTITVFGSQKDSFPFRDQITLDENDGDVTGLAVLDGGSLVVTTTRQFIEFGLGTNGLASTASAHAPDLAFPDGTGNVDPAQVLDIYHLPSWKTPRASTSRDERAGQDTIFRSFEVLFHSGTSIYATTVTVDASGNFHTGQPYPVSDRSVSKLSDVVAGRITYTYTKWGYYDSYYSKREVAVALYFADEPVTGKLAVVSGGATHHLNGLGCATSLDTHRPANVPNLVGVARPDAMTSAFACAGVLKDQDGVAIVPMVTVFAASGLLTSDIQMPISDSMGRIYTGLENPQISLENTPVDLNEARWTLFPRPLVGDYSSAEAWAAAHSDWVKRFPADSAKDKVSLSMMLRADPAEGGASTTVLASRTYCLQDSCGDPNTWRLGLPLLRSLWSTPAAAGSSTDTDKALVFAPLPRTENRVTIAVHDPTKPVLVDGDPVPVAVLAAPPTVRGAGQSVSAPTFTSSKGESGSSGKSESAHVGASVGLEWESPGSMFGASVTASVEREVESSFALSHTVTFSESYTGSKDEDTVIYQTTPQYVFAGTVLGSSSGIGVGTPAAIAIPDTDGITTASATMSYLEDHFPFRFGPGGTYTDSLTRVLTHTVGDPGSYMGSATENLNDYCVGTVDGSSADDLSAGPRLDNNPFFENPPLRSGPDILVSSTHLVRAGAGTTEGAEFSIEKGLENSRVANTTLDVEVAGKAAYVTASVNGGYGWGESYSRTLSEGVSFSAGIGNIPDPDQADESYAWQMFLCNVRLVTNAGSTLDVRVLNYTVDNYHGSGGLDPLGPVTAISPTGSEYTDLTPTLTWQQDSGTVKSYDWQVEAIGTQDRRSGSITYANTIEAQGRDEQTSTDITDDLLPNQLYRWRVTSTDFFGNSTASSWEFFVTEGPPKADFSFNPSTAKQGAEVEFTDSSHTGGLATEQSWTFPDDTVLTGSAVTKAFADTGVQAVTLRVWNEAGQDQITKLVPVVTGSRNDSYEATEDAQLVVATDVGVLANDGAAGTLTATANTPPAHGDLVLADDGSFTYMPEPDFCGADTFDYTMEAGNNFRDTAVVVIDVACVNDPPLAADTTLDATEDAPQHVAAPGLLAHVTDPDIGDTHTASMVDQPRHGTINLAADGSYTYRPDENYCGPDEFTYRANDGELDSTIATVSITVECVNDVPLAVDDHYRTTRDQTLTVDAPGVLANDTDVEDGLASIATLDSGVIHGHLTLNPDGSFTYTPEDGFVGTDSFTYFPGDGTDQSPIPATVTIRVTRSSPPSPPGPPSGGPGAGPGGLAGPGGSGGPGGVEVLGEAEQIRIGGTDRYHTSALIAESFGSAPAVIIANGEPAKQGADALSANYLAGRIHAPIVLTRATTVAEATLSTVAAVLAGQVDPVIYVMGKTDSVSHAVAAKIKAAAAAVSSGAVTVTRIGGEDRYITSAMIATRPGTIDNAISISSGGPARTTAILASGQVTVDALVAGALSYAWGIPVLLTSRDHLSDATATVITDQHISQLLVLGSTDRVSQTVVEEAERAGATAARIAGTDRYATGVQLYAMAMDTMTNGAGEHFADGSGHTAYLANGLTGFPDALSAGPLAGKQLSPLLTVPAARLPEVTASFLADHTSRLAEVTGLGGPTTISQALLNQARGIIG